MQAVGLLHQLGYTNVWHYPGGLTEWFAAEPPSPAETNALTAPARRAASSDSLVGWPSRFVISLADRSVRDLFYLWVGIVIVWGIVYWLMARQSRDDGESGERNLRRLRPARIRAGAAVVDGSDPADGRDTGALRS